ncbi:MAG: sigma-54 dependent transcriptional regulator [Desulfovibrio sp.]|jgi:two-component system response regulator HydG|nr:sigma-54 dependent transcriptional regulator [Desulfovibrio sp.]
MTAELKSHILVVDDDNSHRTALSTLLADWGYSVTAVSDGESAVEACKAYPFDLVLMDVRMTGISGIEALKGIKSHNPAIPVIITTAYSDVGNAVEALKSGAYDYLTKPLDFDELKLTLGRAAEHLKLVDENKALKNTLAFSFDPGDIIGQSPPMRSLLDMVSTIAASEATILITGESGTGKEVIARMIHANSKRRGGPYIAVNCSALTETLLESELFGHEKGAFTGAEKKRDGRFLAADKGTIFLDEIGEMPMPMQAKLLRAIQEREIQRVGDDRTVKVDVRILAATNKDLREEVAAGRFRQDLFYRLDVVSLRLPPLRERSEDIPLLAMHFLKSFARKNEKSVRGFTPGAMDRLMKYAWPGNVRELENTVERAVVLLMGEYVSERELPSAIAECGDGDCPRRTDFSGMTLEEIERIIVTEVVENAGGNKSEAARRLGITRKTLVAKMQGTCRRRDERSCGLA